MAAQLALGSNHSRKQLGHMAQLLSTLHQHLFSFYVCVCIILSLPLSLSPVDELRVQS